MKNLLILGCGYVGRALAQRWQTDPELHVTATTTTPKHLGQLRDWADEAIVLRGDDESALRAVLAETDGLVLSLGAKRGTPYVETYLRTAETLARVLGEGDRLAQNNRPQNRLQQIIYTSSYAVYGDRQGNWVTEADPAQPTNENGEILVQTEQTLLKLQTSKRKVCIFRLGGIYGPGRELAKIFKFAAGKTRPGDGSNPGNWVHLSDIVGAIAFAQSHPLDGLYNLVDSNPLPRKQLLDWVCTEANLDPIRWDPSQNSARAYNARVSNQKLQDAGYRFKYPSAMPEEAR